MAEDGAFPRMPPDTKPAYQPQDLRPESPIPQYDIPLAAPQPLPPPMGGITASADDSNTGFGLFLSSQMDASQLDDDLEDGLKGKGWMRT